MLKLNDGRAELYQWDTGRTATVAVECDEVHFSHMKFGEAVNVKVIDGQVLIPNELLRLGLDVYCWAFVRTKAGGYTRVKKRFDVKKRPKPADYITTPDEQATWTELESRIEALENGGGGTNTEEMDKLNRVLVMSRNLFDKSAVTNGGRINPDTGVIELYADTGNESIRYTRFSDYIPVVGGESYVYSGGASDGRTVLESYVFLDENKSYISGENRGATVSQEGVQLVAPANAAYIVINSNMSYSIDNVQFERGTVQTEYVSYGVIVNADRVDGLDELLAEAKDSCIGTDKIVHEEGMSKTKVMSQFGAMKLHNVINGNIEAVGRRVDGLEDGLEDTVKDSVESYLEDNPVEAPVASVNGKTGAVDLSAEDVGAISQDGLQDAVNVALAQAKDSGEFDGDDYVLTEADKTEIAQQAAALIDASLLSAIGSGVIA